MGFRVRGLGMRDEGLGFDFEGLGLVCSRCASALGHFSVLTVLELSQVQG